MSFIFAGYAGNHKGNYYRKWELIKQIIYVTRDVVWLKRMYYPTPAIANNNYFIEIL